MTRKAKTVLILSDGAQEPPKTTLGRFREVYYELARSIQPFAGKGKQVMPGKSLSLLSTVILFGCLQLLASGPSFHPDTTFTGSSLAGWHTIGGAQWHAESGELIGTPKPSGGWLVLDRSYQDVGLYLRFRCVGGCETGVLLRAEKTPTGLRGIYVALSDPDLAVVRRYIGWARPNRRAHETEARGRTGANRPASHEHAGARISPARIDREAAF